ncbi:SUMO protease ULP2 [Aspergillus stella-maris]|uniref:SUMO protease ULP2 n=1 Tax=Aspergillus stella-maris TaxID=1810926 RepID=UPI003CCCD184
MQFLKDLSESIFSRPPPQPPSEPSPPSTSETDISPPTNATASLEPPVRNALAPNSKDSKDPAPFDSNHLQNDSAAQNRYANSYRPPRKPDSVRRLLRQSIPPPGSGMPKPSRERDSIEDETRLFGGGKQRDPHSVRIIPGQTFASKKPVCLGHFQWAYRSANNCGFKGAAASFKPLNSLSRGAKFSGPVRASGKETYYSSQNRPKSFADSPERSSKRRRVESPEEISKRVTISDDESGPETENYKLDKGAKGLKKSASYADRLSSEDQDLVSFTRDAAKERRRESGSHEQVARKLPEQSSNLSVEIAKKPSIVNNQVTVTPPPHHSGKSRASYSRDSPDELQGGVTVGPVPTSLGKYNEPSSDIQPTVFISNDKSKRGHKNKKGKASKRNLPASQTFKIFYYRSGPFLKDALGGENDQLIVNPGDDKLTVQIADSGIVHTISLQKVLKVLVGGRASRKIRFELSKVDRNDTKLDLELSTPKEKETLCSLLRLLKADVQEKDEKYIDSAFRKSEREHLRYQASTNGYKRQLQIEITQETPSKPSSGPTKRMKLSDALQEGYGAAAAQKNPDTPSRERPSPSRPSASPRQNANGEHQSSPSATRQNVGVEIPVKKFHSDLRAPARSTRSAARQERTTLVCDDDDDIEDDPENHSPQPALDDVDQKWNRKPLVYPRFGKKKAEVNAIDLERLAPHEFLNDNIIGFYIRFLEDHLQRCNAEAAKRVYFFNSYFFDTLTNSRRRAINYEGVEKWTRSVDLFSYDYIVVPINEAAHWYLAVICNLPYLEGIMKEGKPPVPASLASGDVHEVPETPEPSQLEEGANSQPLKEENARQSLASMNLSDEKLQAGAKSGDDEWPEKEENPGVARAKLSDYSSQPQSDSQKTSNSTGTPKKPRKPKRKSTTGMKYNTCQPIVITFDSLNQGRSSTISTLREYLFAEAKSKRGIEINKTLIKGMTAKEIPEQPNFSDCGLYLLAYVEKFVQDPDVFVRKLLRKEMRSKEDWPPLRSGLLRSRLFKFMELLYSEQEQLTKTQADEGTLMVDQQPISYLLGTPTTDERKEKVKAEEGKLPQVQVQVERSPPPEVKPKEPSRSRDTSAELDMSKPDKSDVKQDQITNQAGAQESVIFLDQKSNPHTELPVPGTDKLSESVKRVLVEVPDSQEKTNFPPTEAAHLNGTQSPKPPTKRTDAVYVDGSEANEGDISQQPEAGSSSRVQVNETPPRSPAAR